MPQVAVQTEPEAIRDALERGAVRRVLALRASRLGDLLMTTPALHAFRERWPDCTIDFVTNRYSAMLLQGNPDVDRVHVVQGREKDLLSRRNRAARAKLAAEPHDLLLALRPRRSLVAFCRALGIPRLFPGGEQDLERPGQHVVEQCFARLAPLGLHGAPGPMLLSAPDDIELATKPGERPLVLLHPGCDETFRLRWRRRVNRRTWPIALWAELADRLARDHGLRVVLSSGSATEARWVERILSNTATDAEPAPCNSLDDLFGWMGRSAAVVTVDTGPMHIACALGVPLVALFGPSPPGFTGPWCESACVLRVDLPCSPCQGKSVRCARNVCMEEIRPERVAREVARRVRDSTRNAAPVSEQADSRASRNGADGSGAC